MNKVSVIAIMLGVASLAASGALYLTRQHHVAPVINVQPAPVTVQQAPAPVVNVQAPKPYVCTPQQAEAGECLPLAPAKPAVEPPKVVAPPEISTGPKRKVTKVTKKKSNAAKKLHSQWSK